jgi:hypothetical protein
MHARWIAAPRRHLAAALSGRAAAALPVPCTLRVALRRPALQRPVGTPTHSTCTRALAHPPALPYSPPHTHPGAGSAVTSDVRYLSADDPTGQWKVILERKNDVEYNVADRAGSFYITIRGPERPNSELLVAPMGDPTSTRVGPGARHHRPLPVVVPASRPERDLGRELDRTAESRAQCSALADPRVPRLAGLRCGRALPVHRACGPPARPRARRCCCLTAPR